MNNKEAHVCISYLEQFPDIGWKKLKRNWKQAV